MKHQSTIVSILLNILFCAILLWFFSMNAYLRPYLGSVAKEFLSGLLLLAALYANYYVFYPKLHRGHIYVYWFSVVAASLTAGCLELALGYKFITKCYALIIAETGTFGYFAKHMIGNVLEERFAHIGASYNLGGIGAKCSPYRPIVRIEFTHYSTDLCKR